VPPARGPIGSARPDQAGLSLGAHSNRRYQGLARTRAAALPLIHRVALWLATLNLLSTAAQYPLGRSG